MVSFKKNWTASVGNIHRGIIKNINIKTIFQIIRKIRFRASFDVFGSFSNHALKPHQVLLRAKMSCSLQQMHLTFAFVRVRFRVDGRLFLNTTAH